MKIILIAGGASNVGKTFLAEMILRRVENWAACKVTTCIGGSRHSCPRGLKHCNVCRSLKTDYEIEEERVCSSDKDTSRMLKAGAKKSLWIKAKPQFLKTAITEVIKKLEGYEGIVFEGNHALKVLRKSLKPDVAVMVLPNSVAMKKSAQEILPNIDIFAEKIDMGLLDKIMQFVSL